MQNEIKINQIKDKFPFYLLVFFPVSLVTGPLFAELLMNLFSITFLYQIIKEKKFIYFKKLYVILYLIFFLYILINSFLSDYNSKIFLKNLFHFRHAIFALAILYFLEKNNNWLIFIFKFLVLTLLIVSIDGYIQYFFHSNILGFEKIRVDRLSGFFNDQLIIGSFLVRLFPLMISIFFYYLNIFSYREKILYILIFITIFILIILSGERAALLIGISFLIFFFILIKLNKKLKLLFVIIFFPLIFSSFYFVDNVYDRYFKQTIQQINFNFSNKNYFSNFLYYSHIYETAFKGFKDKIFLGQGGNSYRHYCAKKKFITFKKSTRSINLQEIIEKPGTYNFSETIIPDKKYKKGDLFFKYLDKNVLKSQFVKEDIEVAKYIQGSSILHYYYYSNGCTSHPHNFLLQVLSELGLVGLVFYLIFFIYLLFSLFKIFFEKDNYNLNYLNFKICLTIGLFSVLIPFLPSGNFFNNWLNMITFFPIGFYLFALKKNKIL